MSSIENSRSATPALGRADVLALILVLLAYAVVATQQIGLPGVYMDSVNPDYMVVRIINSRAEHITPWLLPGNYLFERFPVLISFYHGSQQFWLGLPFYWMFGTDVIGIRLTHAMFAAGVLAATYAYLRVANVRVTYCALASIALAIDPAFSYAFRTQSYITLAPAAWLFLSLLAHTKGASEASHPKAWIFLSGASYGLAVAGYFIYSFFAPALLWFFIRRYGPHGFRTRGVVLFSGLVLGASPYVFGYVLAIDYLGGVSQAWEYFQSTQRALNAFSQQPDLPGRVSFLAANIDSVFRNWYHHSLIFGEPGNLPWGNLKSLILLGGPLLLFLAARFRRQAWSTVDDLVALGVSFLVIASLFGTRLSGHHFMVLLPISYAALCAGASELVTTSKGVVNSEPRKLAAMVGIFALLTGINSAGQIAEAEQLAKAKGAGLYSDAINRLGSDLSATSPSPVVYFPDWGLLMPVTLLTGGRVAVESVIDYEAARSFLCRGRNVAVAVVTGDRRARVAAWQRSINWDAPTIVSYEGHAGDEIFVLATFAGKRGAVGCP